MNRRRLAALVVIPLIVVAVGLVVIVQVNAQGSAAPQPAPAVLYPVSSQGTLLPAVHPSPFTMVTNPNKPAASSMVKVIHGQAQPVHWEGNTLVVGGSPATPAATPSETP